MSYFDNQAENYSSRSHKGIWKRVRELERDPVLNFLNAQPGEKILDVGCGAGYYTRFIRERGAEVVGIDSSQKMIEQFRANGWPGLLGDFVTYSFKNRFDKILIAGAGEFISDVTKLLTKAEEVLVEGGSAVVLAPRRNLWGQMYKTWHKSHGTSVFLHDYRKAVVGHRKLLLKSSRNVTPMTCVMVFEKQS